MSAVMFADTISLPIACLLVSFPHMETEQTA